MIYPLLGCVARSGEDRPERVNKVLEKYTNLVQLSLLTLVSVLVLLS